MSDCDRVCEQKSKLGEILKPVTGSSPKCRLIRAVGACPEDRAERLWRAQQRRTSNRLPSLK